jgi:hypothetical protein
VTQVQRIELPDKITWRFTENGVYSSRSAYRIQFIGSYANHEWDRLWKSKVENKCKFFLWLLLHNNRIIWQGGHANTICQICQPKSAFHIMAQCSISRQIWAQMASWIGINMQSCNTPCYKNTNQVH